MLNVYDEYETIGDSEKIDDGSTIGHSVKIGDDVGIGDSVKIGDNVGIGNWVTIGDNVGIGDYVKIGNWAKIGERVEVGYGATIGDCVTIGDKFRCEGLEVIDFFTMSNVDGTGRRINIYVHTAGITIRAGCFEGTLDDFCNKAEDEGKCLYAVTVRAAAEAFAAEIKRQGKTGGWDK